MIKDKINGYGVLFRFITPILIALILFILTQIVGNINDLKVLFNNHLEHHRVIEVSFAERFAHIETLLSK